MRISVVTTLYKSSPYIEEFLIRIVSTVEKITNDYEIILVNDGSPDSSYKICKKLLDYYQNITLINLSKNFGHHPAMMQGLSYAIGDYVFLIDCDLEEPPEVLATFYEEIIDRNCDVIYGVQAKKSKRRGEDFFRKLYYKLFILITNISIPSDILTVRLMKNNYVQALIQYNEKELIIGGIWYLVGFEQHAFPVLKSKKELSAYNLQMKISYFLDSLISFSFKPLYLFCILGVSIFILSTICISYTFLKKFFLGSVLSGWTSTMMSIWFLGGTTILFLSVISLYLAKIFSEVKNRPRTVIKEVLRSKVKVSEQKIKKPFTRSSKT